MAASTVYRLVIEPCSSFLTSLQSDTIMGHLAWMAAYRDQDEVTSLIERYKSGAPPFVVSSGFPHGHLPVPILKPLTYKERRRLAKEFFSRYGLGKGRVMLDSCLKEIKKQKYIPIESWEDWKAGLSTFLVAKQLLEQALCCDLTGQINTEKKYQEDRVVMRTAINRLTGMAAEGLLYDHEECYFARNHSVDIWFRFFDKGMILNVEKWLDDLSMNGFGANSSSGAGQFAVKSFEKVENVLPNMETPNAYMSLSHFSPAKDDPLDGWYSHIIKRGKLGGTFACAGIGSTNASKGANVWKYPLVMFAPGSVFKTENKKMEQYYGRLIKDIHYYHKSVVHFAYSFPLYIRLKDGD